MAKYRIVYLPDKEVYRIETMCLLGGWAGLGQIGPGGTDLDYEFTTQQYALDFLDEYVKPRPSTKPAVVWEGER